MILALINEDLHYTAFLEAEVKSEQKAQELLVKFKEVVKEEEGIYFSPEYFQYFLEKKEITAKQLASQEVAQLHFVNE